MVHYKSKATCIFVQWGPVRPTADLQLNQNQSSKLLNMESKHTHTTLQSHVLNTILTLATIHEGNVSVRNGFLLVVAERSRTQVQTLTAVH